MATLDSEEKKKPWLLESSELPEEDQKWLWDYFKDFEEDPTATSDPREIRLLKEKKNKEKNESVGVDVKDTYKRRANTELTQSRHGVIAALKECHYRTPFNQVAILLDKLFRDCGSRSNYWFYVAENWTPRQINWTLACMTKLYGVNWTGINNPAAYFTAAIKHRKRRKK